MSGKLTCSVERIPQPEFLIRSLFRTGVGVPIWFPPPGLSFSLEQGISRYGAGADKDGLKGPCGDYVGQFLMPGVTPILPAVPLFRYSQSTSRVAALAKCPFRFRYSCRFFGRCSAVIQPLSSTLLEDVFVLCCAAAVPARYTLS